MKRHAFLFLAGMTCLVLVAPQALAAGESAATTKPSEEAQVSGLRGEYAIMASVTKMDDAQKAKLLAQVQANEKAVQDWDAANGEKIRKIEAELEALGEKATPEKVKSLNDDLDALNNARFKVEKDGKTALLALLSPDQKVLWEGFTAYRQMSLRYRRAKLTETQDQAVRKLCDDAGKSLLDAKDAKARMDIIDAIAKEISEKVLTEAQRETLVRRSGRNRTATQPAKTEATSPK